MVGRHQSRCRDGPSAWWSHWSASAVIVAALINAFSDADRVIVRLIVVVAIMAIAIALARFALFKGVDTDEAGATAGRSAPSHPVLICNPWSGGGKVEKFGLVELAGTLGVEVVMLDHGLDLEQLARDAIARGADCLGMAGGDGSQALVASIAIEHDLPFVCVSAGTRNHFALDLGLNRDDPRASMSGFTDAVERRVDYARVNGRLFVNNVSLGIYATVVQSDEYRDAKAATFSSMLPQLLGPNTEPFDLQFHDPDGREIDGAFLVMVSNNPYVIGTSLDELPAATPRHRTARSHRHRCTGSRARHAGLVAASAAGLRQRSRYWHEFAAARRSRSGPGPGRRMSASTARPSRWTRHFASRCSPKDSDCSCPRTTSSQRNADGPGMSGCRT